ncbi:MAG: PAS domain-containing protein [Oryzomonas sp.]|uniref:PAS domain-containing protein n=1 Tax=Oryzomonas sp. TaxID=2855186 RepID=UPI00283BF93D|nr:PAS domain-containing protein [Oryzomonas sp.]MDR3578495.1 PAS domain-containing protein [Oryzomonas sp.]
MKDNADWPRIAIRYTVTVALVAAAVSTRRWLVNSFGPMPIFITFYPAVLMAASISGGGPGILASVLSSLAASYWFIAPYHSFAVNAPNDAVALGLFFCVSLTLSILMERLRRARWLKAVSVAHEQDLALLDMGNLISLDMDRRIVRWSNGCSRLYGFDAQEAHGRLVDELLKTTLTQPLEQILPDLMEHNYWEGELIRQRKDGKELELVILLAVRRDEQGGPSAFLEVSTDITRQKESETILRESEYFFRESQRAAFIGSYKADFIAGTWESSEVLDAIFGIDENYNRSIRGWLDLVHPDDRDMLDQYLREEVIAQGKPFSKEYRIIRAGDGETRWVYGSGVVHADSSGNTVSLIGTIHDITDRKLAFEQLENISLRLQLATASANLGVWDWNVRDNRMDWDDRMFELYGITRDTFTNRFDDWVNRLHQEDRETAVAACRSALNGEQVFDATFRICHPDGTVKHIKANALVLNGKDGTAERMIGVNTDITDKAVAEKEKATLEAQLRQAQKMESIGRLAGGVAHDFNNMLTVIFGHVQLALMNANLTSPLHTSLEEIHKAAERSAGLTRQLLAFARKQIIAPISLDLNETVGGMFKMLQRLIGEDMHITWHPANDLWPVRMDPSQIDQILVNLCINARDAIYDVGKITIETGNWVFDKDYCATHLGFLPGEYVRLVVSDNGRGMDKETLSHIFEPFFTTKDSGKGTGLGLATVYGIVKQNQGFINVYSEPNQGTTFTIYLPRHEGNAGQADKHGTKESLSRGNETILLVEDEPAILKITSLMLTMQGYTVLTANTTDEAIRLAREYSEAIQLLMIDVIMPGMNGRDLAKCLLSEFPHIKHLFMSGYTANVIVHHGVLDEGVNFIQKPFSLPVLANKVREILDNTYGSRSGK